MSKQNSYYKNKRKLVKSFLCFLIIFSIHIGAYVEYSSNTAKAASISSKVESDTIESTIIKALVNMKPQINIKKYNIKTLSKLKDIYEGIILNNPQLFYVDNKVELTDDSKTNTITSINIKYLDSKKAVESKYTKINEEVGKILAYISPQMTDYEKALAVHDYFALNYSYDNSKNLSIDAYNIYGLFVKKTAVCQGYALGYQYILRTYLGIDCTVVTSDSMDHAWNMVRLNGNYYHVDTTYDDSVPNQVGGAFHTLFMISDAKLRSNKYSNWSAVAAATDTSYDIPFFEDVQSALQFQNGKWFYSDIKGNIYEYNFTSNIKKLLYNVSDKWSVWNNPSYTYKKSYVKIALDGDVIYFNTPKEIYRMSTDGSNVTKIYEVDGTNGYLYGVAFIDNMLCVSIKTAQTDESENVINLNIKKNNVLKPVSVTNMMDDISYNLYKNSIISLTSIKPTVSSKTIKKGEHYQINVNVSPSNSIYKKLSYVSSNAKVATVSNAGYVSTIGFGICDITIRSVEDSKIFAKLKITVAPPMVTKLTIKKLSPYSNKLAWAKISGSTGYEIYRSNKKNGRFEKIKSTNQTNYIDRAIVNKKKYYYKVRAYKLIKKKKINGYFSSVK